MEHLDIIPFNRPFLTGKETHYIYDAVYKELKLSGNGLYTKKCQSFFEDRYGYKKCLLTTSCTDALEMSALLIDIKPGDEVIIPSYTFVSTALAFARQGAIIRFIDSRSDHPGMDENLIESLITPKTKAIVPVHYAGVACNMDKIMSIANKYNLFVIEDSAQSIDSYYIDKPLGGIGHFGCFSFHETKNVQCGEGGMLIINDKRFFKRAEIIWEKGTNRAEFFRGEVNKYGWVDIGSSFLPSDILAAFLFAQLENLDEIQKKRKELWLRYYTGLSHLQQEGTLKLPFSPDYSSNNAHMFYIVCKTLKERTAIIDHLRSQGIHSVFHYLSLHKSPYYKELYQGEELVNSDYYSDCLVRLPFFYDLQIEEVDYICKKVVSFYK